MRILLALAIVVLSYEPARACIFEFDAPPGFDAAPVGAVPNRQGLVVLPARPIFFAVGSSWAGEQLPTFRRPDGEPIAYSIVQGFTPGSTMHALRVAADSGVVHVPYSGSKTEAYVIDPTFVPRTRSTRFESDEFGRWMWADTDAVLLRIERDNGAVEFDSDARIVFLSDNTVQVTALYADGREEMLYGHPAPCGTMLLQRSHRREREVAAKLVLLFGAFLFGIGLTRRIRAAGS
jgi:hypothetical protein